MKTILAVFTLAILPALAKAEDKITLTAGQAQSLYNKLPPTNDYVVLPLARISEVRTLDGISCERVTETLYGDREEFTCTIEQVNLPVKTYEVKQDEIKNRWKTPLHQ